MSNKTTNIVKQVHLFTNGDPSVGISGESATLSSNGNFLIDLEVFESGEAALEDFRAQLAKVFTGIWGEPAKVMFDFESSSNAADTAVESDAAVEAISFALNGAGPEGLQFLRLWNEGEFDIIRREWPEAPESIFIGADPLYKRSI